MTIAKKATPDVTLDFVDDGAIAILTLTDAARGNAMSPEMGDALRAKVETLKTCSHRA